jgi:Holliday junction resolvase
LNTKAKGRRIEHKVRDIYSALGYRVIRSAASLKEWDLVAIGKHDTYLIQCKAGSSKPSKKEVERMEQFECPPFMHKVLVLWPDRAKEPTTIPIAKSRAEKETVDMLTHPKSPLKDKLDKMPRWQVAEFRGCSCGGWDELKIAHGENCKAVSRGAIYENCRDMYCKQPHTMVPIPPLYGTTRKCHEFDEPLRF